jgi:beta-glucosidase
VLHAVLAGAAAGIDAREPEQAQDRPEHRRLARRAAGEAIVLLKNAGALLPLDAGRLRRLAVLGPNAGVARIQGGGSSRVEPHYAVTPLDGIAARCGAGVELLHEPGCAIHRRLPALAGAGFRLELFRGAEPRGAPACVRAARRLDWTWLGAPAPGVDVADFSARCTGRFTARRAGPHRFGLSAVGRARLFADGALLVDNWTRPERGDSFYGAGSREVEASLELAAGQSVEIAIELAKQDARPVAGLRAGVEEPLGADAFERALAAARGADAAIVVVGLDGDWESEGRDRADMELPGRQAELVLRVAQANPATVVVLNCGSPVTADWIERVPAALALWYPGQECGNALADVLFGERNPAGRLPQTWPARLAQNPAHPFYPGSGGRVHYGESVFVGYRYYEAAGATPRFPFGHGLSYTSFSYGELRTSAPVYRRGEAIDVFLDVTNTGSRAGQEVVQLYLHDAQASAARPEQELRAFAKVELAPGETRTLRFTLGERDLAFWDAARHAFAAEPGDFELRAGSSSADLRARARFAFAL